MNHKGYTLCSAVACIYTVQPNEPQRVLPSCLTWSQKSSTLDYAVLRSCMTLLCRLCWLMSS